MRALGFGFGEREAVANSSCEPNLETYLIVDFEMSKPEARSLNPKRPNGAAPVRDPGFSTVTPCDGAGCNDPAPAAPQPSHRQVLPPA